MERGSLASQDVEEREEAGRVARVDERDRRLEDALARAREVDELGDRRVQARLERGRWSKEGDVPVLCYCSSKYYVTALRR